MSRAPPPSALPLASSNGTSTSIATAPRSANSATGGTFSKSSKTKYELGGSGPGTPKSATFKNGHHKSSSLSMDGGSAVASSSSSGIYALSADAPSNCSHIDALLASSDPTSAAAKLDVMKDRLKKVALWAARRRTIEREVAEERRRMERAGGEGEASSSSSSSAAALPTCASPECSSGNASTARLLTRPLVCLDCGASFCRPESSTMTMTDARATASGSRAEFESRWGLTWARGGGSSSGGGVKVDTSRSCWTRHANETGHQFAVDAHTSAIHCAPCGAFTFPEALLGGGQVAIRAARLAEEKSDRSIERGGHERKRFKPAKSDHAGVSGSALIGAGDAQRGLRPIRCLGLRPLLNLSQTCFLSAVLQAFLHNPLWKSYYLAAGHERKLCELARAKRQQEAAQAKLQAAADGGGSDGGSVAGSTAGDSVSGEGGGGGDSIASATTNVGECIGCEMDSAFAEAHGEDAMPFGPVALLYSMWRASAELAGHAQQDAHTFLLAALNQIHAHTAEKIDEPGDCPCIAHRSFAGSLQSTVTCSRCGTSTHTLDPILDLSLELKSSNMAIDDPLVGLPPGTLSLASCLRRYTAKEALMGKAYACGKCGGDGQAQATKQLSIKRLPNTLAIQLKRFEQNSTNFSKVETMVHFPTVLDMRPYVTSTLQADPNTNATLLPEDMYRYELSTVVTHEGRLDNGHYWADVRAGCEWFHCDDDKITPTTLSQVLSQKAYILFYNKRSVAYEVKT